MCPCTHIYIYIYTYILVFDSLLIPIVIYVYRCIYICTKETNIYVYICICKHRVHLIIYFQNVCICIVCLFSKHIICFDNWSTGCRARAESFRTQSSNSQTGVWGRLVGALRCPLGGPGGAWACLPGATSDTATAVLPWLHWLCAVLGGFWGCSLL